MALFAKESISDLVGLLFISFITGQPEIFAENECSLVLNNRTNKNLAFTGVSWKISEMQ